jgi:hypothetical protein
MRVYLWKDFQQDGQRPFSFSSTWRPSPRSPKIKAENMLSEDQIFADEKRNCGHTGPTSPEGRAISARNATRHGMCAKTLILDHENEQDWLQLLNT